jgi:hypothetical protein
MPAADSSRLAISASFRVQPYALKYGVKIVHRLWQTSMMLQQEKPWQNIDFKGLSLPGRSFRET